LKQECRLIDLPKIHDPRGNLTVVEQNVQIPFKIKRVYFLYDVAKAGVAMPIKIYSS